jgi:hypothetical protein
VIHLAEQRAAENMGDSLCRVHYDPAKLGEVDDETVVDAAEAGAVVSAAPDRDVDTRITAGIHGRHHISDVDGARDQARTFVDHRVVDLARQVVLGMVRSDQSPPTARRESLDQNGARENLGHVHHPPLCDPARD